MEHASKGKIIIIVVHTSENGRINTVTSRLLGLLFFAGKGGVFLFLFVAIVVVVVAIFAFGQISVTLFLCISKSLPSW